MKQLYNELMNRENLKGTPQNVRQQAKALRREMTPQEKLLWEALRNRRLGGLKFRRQHPVGPFIADFYCAEARLIVEVDGEIHRAQYEADQQRTEQLLSFNYRVQRFQNEQIEYELDNVLKQILEACQQFLCFPELKEGDD